VSALEAGRRADLTVSEVVLLSEALGISAGELFVGPGRVDVGDTTMSLADFRARLAPRQAVPVIADDPFATVTERAWARQLGMLPHEVEAAATRYWGQSADQRVAGIVERLVGDGRLPNDDSTLEQAEREAFIELEELLEAGGA